MYIKDRKLNSEQKHVHVCFYVCLKFYRVPLKSEIYLRKVFFSEKMALLKAVRGKSLKYLFPLQKQHLQI